MKYSSFKFSKKAHTIIEMSIAVLVFSIILAGLFEVLNIGLKCWQLGDISTETQQGAEISIKCIMKELKYSNKYTCNYGKTSSSEYIAFDTALNEGKVEYEFFNQTPLWQTYIVYYTLYDPESITNTKILYRRSVTHSIYPLPQNLNPSVSPNYLVTDKKVSSVPGVEETLKIVSKNVKEFNITEEGDLISINLICFRAMGEKKLAYAQNFDRNTGATIEVSSSVSPRN